nr:hypothetical protein BaRGS_005441 [Batillaria attramentaria]
MTSGPRGSRGRPSTVGQGQGRHTRRTPAFSARPESLRHTETTFAEMAYNHNDPEEARDNHQDEDNAQRSTDSFPNGHCRSDDRPDSHLNGWVTRWQPDRHGRDSNRNNSSSTPDIPQRWRMGVIAENGSACNSVVRNGRVHDVHERSRETEFGVSSSSSFHGFSKHNNDSQVGSYPPRKEYVCAKYNPRRNSYAAAIANPSWIELPPLRRHSDDSHHVASCSRAQNCVKNPRVRERGRSQDGADNPAFDSADDSVAL